MLVYWQVLLLNLICYQRAYLHLIPTSSYMSASHHKPVDNQYSCWSHVKHSVAPPGAPWNTHWRRPGPPAAPWNTQWRCPVHIWLSPATVASPGGTSGSARATMVSFSRLVVPRKALAFWFAHEAPPPGSIIGLAVGYSFVCCCYICVVKKACLALGHRGCLALAHPHSLYVFIRRPHVRPSPFVFIIFLHVQAAGWLPKAVGNS